MNSGYCGSEYDRYVDRSDDSALAKMKQQYYTAKQAIRSKFGKKEDDFLVASDAELDAKLAVYYSVKESCENMLRCIERYQDYICELSQEENALGRFLKQRGKADKTQAGKMMSAVGRAQGFSAQQRLALRVPLVRLYQELEVFTERAVGDCRGTVEATERARIEYRGSLLWMKKVSEELDPDTYRQLERFRKVQAQVKRKKAKFDKYKLDCLQKVDLLAASRCNLFSQLMANYQNCVLHFWERTSAAHSTVSENFKGYQHYEFTILKDLSEPSRRLAELTSGSVEDNEIQQTENAAEATESDEQLILLDEEKPAVPDQTWEEKKFEEQPDSLEHFLLKDSPDGEQTSLGATDDLLRENLTSREAAQQIPKLPPPPSGAIFYPESKTENNFLSHLDAKTEDIMPSGSQTLDDFFGDGAAAEDTFTFQWQQTFGKDVSQIQVASSTSTASGNLQDSPLHGAEASLHGCLPSELFDSQLLERSGQSVFSPLPTPMGVTDQTVASGLAPGPTVSKNTDERRTDVSEQNKKSAEPRGQKRSAWFSLFADLDPLSNPDAVGKPSGDENNPC